MTDRKMFADADVETKRFYSRIINTAVANIYAVDNKLFGALICESDDPMIMERWLDAEPLIVDTIQRRIDTGEDMTWMDF